MTPELMEDIDPTAPEAALMLDSCLDAINVEAGETTAGPGPGDDTVLTWARAL